MSRIRGVIFDLDGTLVDSYPAITASLNHARSSHGLPPLPEEKVRRQVGRGLEALIADLVGPDRVESGVLSFRECYARVFREGTRVLDGVAETLERLSMDGFRMAVASNKPARFSRPILEHFGLAGYFGSIQGPDLAGATKPDPRMIELCMKDLGVVPEEAIYVGDMVLDVLSGEQAGLPVILVTGGSSETSTLMQTGKPVLDSIRQLPERIQEVSP